MTVKRKCDKCDYVAEAYAVNVAELDLLLHKRKVHGAR